MTLGEALTSWLIPSVIGFAFGYLTCLLVVRAVKDEGSPVDGQHERRAQLARTLFGVLLILLSTATFVQSYRATSCLRDGIIERSSANGREARAQIVLLEAQIDNDPTNDLPAIREYLEAARELERVRETNPLRCT